MALSFGTVRKLTLHEVPHPKTYHGSKQDAQFWVKPASHDGNLASLRSIILTLPSWSSDAKQNANCDLVSHVFTLLILILTGSFGYSVLYWPLRFCFIFLVHVLKRAAKMNFRMLHMENGGSCAHVWCLRLPYFVFHWVLGERISHVLFLSCVSQPSRASRNYHWPPKQYKQMARVP